MDTGAIEGLAVAFYKRHGRDPSMPCNAATLARAELGDNCIVRGVPLFGANAVTFWREGRRLIALRKNLPIPYALFHIFHELAHLIFEVEKYEADDLERACDYLGACLMVPRPAAGKLYSVFGSDFSAIAEATKTTETMIALRLAEVRGTARVVLTPRKVYDRLPEEWVHPPDSILRELERAKMPGLTKTRLRDDRKRIVLDFDQTA